MGLVDYSESESDSEAPPKPPPPFKTSSTSTTTGKKPFQKVVDRSNPSKIVVNLPPASSSSSSSSASAQAQDTNDGAPPPAKRARTDQDAGKSRFSGFNSFLPPPKNASGNNNISKRPGPISSSSSSNNSSSASKPRPGVNLRTSAAPGFSRGGDDEDEIVMGGGDDNDASGGSIGLPPPRNKPAQPSVPEGQKAAEDVQLVGKPMMFKPLSVSRNSKKQKKKATPQSATPASTSATSKNQTPANGATTTTGAAAGAQPQPPQKVSLFSMHTEEPSEPSGARATNGFGSGAYEPLFETEIQTSGYVQPEEELYAQYAQSAPGNPPPTESLGSIADDLHLSAAERRELFGRSGEASGGQMAKKVINFNIDREYQHNEELRASGEQQTHNPVRAIQAAGKNSLRQLVSNVQNQREALEDSFAKGKNSRKEGAGRYGW